MSSTSFPTQYSKLNRNNVAVANDRSVSDSAPSDTDSNKDTGKVSHATGDSKVPKVLQEGLPEKVEKAVPNAIHDTSGAKFADGSVGK